MSQQTTIAHAKQRWLSWQPGWSPGPLLDNVNGMQFLRDRKEVRV